MSKLLTLIMFSCFVGFRYCTDEVQTFLQLSLLESHVILMHGIKNPDLSQIAKAKAPAEDSTKVIGKASLSTTEGWGGGGGGSSVASGLSGLWCGVSNRAHGDVI